METSPSSGRRARNKQEKLQRILSAATELFAEYGVDDVTTQQIAARADIGTGTLFLYAKTKGELLLMVQNAHYADALEEGREAAARESDALGAILAIARPIIECNRVHVGNGRTYLREMIFGDPEEPHHAAALGFVEQSIAALTALITERTGVDADEALTRARGISAALFVTLALAANGSATIDELLAEFSPQAAILIPVRADG